MLVASAVSFLAGVTAAWRRGSVVDKAFIVSLAGARAVPEYAIASGLLILFAVAFPVFPMTGAQTPFAHYPSWWEQTKDIFNHLVLPAGALTLGLAANKFLIVRNTVISTLGEDYMLLARAKGLPRRLLKYRHSGRNALLPFLTAFGVQLGFAVSGSLFVETVFADPGIGTLVNAAVTARDYPLLQGLFLMLALVVIAVNFVVDLAYKWVDPRVA
jgi:peptide/nickel transport system permease protein